MWQDDERDYTVKRLLVIPMFYAGAFPVALCIALTAGYIGVVTWRFEWRFELAKSLFQYRRHSGQ